MKKLLLLFYFGSSGYFCKVLTKRASGKYIVIR